VVDAEHLDFHAAFDAVFSNAALHWMKRADAVIAGVWEALVPGGRFVAECGGAGCVARDCRRLAGGLARRGIDSSALDPWYFPTVADYQARLEACGFAVEYIALIPRPTPLPATSSPGSRRCRELHGAAAVDQRGEFLAEVRDALRRNCTTSTRLDRRLRPAALQGSQTRG
jgi:SAM-dependent methyltransferase